MIVCILGRQPRIGAAELEALYGSDAVRVLDGGRVALLDVDTVNIELGGTIKVASLIETLPTTRFETLSTQLSKRLPRYVTDTLPAEGKIKFGISLYGIKADIAQLSRAALYLKKSIKRAGRSVRVVPNNELSLSSAQVIHNQLTSELGLEILLIRDGDTTLVARTTHEQDIEAYTLRDRGRPMRDTFVGMLPPKLAQIMVHLGIGDREMGNRDNDTLQAEAPPIPNSQPPLPMLLDPFCGTGVILQEAALQGYGIYGTDLSEKMVRYTRDNIVWLFDTHRIHTERYFEVADAQSHTWRQPIDAVVCEGYLGQPMSMEPPRERLQPIITECDAILQGFLTNLAPQLSPGTRLCIAAPAWHAHGEVHHLPILDDLEDLGYNRIDFVHADRKDLIYHREDQIVGRELLVLTRR